MAQKPNMIIFAGCNGLGPIVARHVIPLQGEPLVSHLRIVDKFSIFPPTTYVSKDFAALLQDRKDVVEYRQANLAVPAVVAKCFTDPAPNGQPYIYVLDASGDRAFDRPTEVQISQTLNVALGIAREAAKQGTVKAYVRGILAFYDQATEKKRYKEDDEESWKPLGLRGVWWHETIRAVASVPGLPLIVLRGAYTYGPGEMRHVITKAILLGLVYRSLGEEMKFLYSPKLKRNTIHSKDLAGAAWAACEWAAGLDREKMDALAGVSIPPSGDESVRGVPEAIQKEQGGIIAPVFNIVDDGDLDQAGMAETISKVFGIKCGFYGTIASALSKLKFETIVEEVNDTHIAEWTNIIHNLADPPVPSTPLSPYALPYQLERHGCALDGDKFKKIVGFKCAYPQFDVNSVKETIEFYRTEGIWPETNQYPPS